MQNQLYPIFLKVTRLNTLIVGGGSVATEKLTFLLKSSPSARVQLVAPLFNESIIDLAKTHNVELIGQDYSEVFLENKHVVIVATNKDEVNKQVYKACKKRNILVNLADNPEYCDFYMGGIVTKGNLKIAISTNGKSPTIAKRLRQFFEDILPDNLNELIENLNNYRTVIKGNFKEKVEKLNKFTKELVFKINKP